MTMGPWINAADQAPAEPGLYPTRGDGEALDWWRYWDGRHWSRGQWTRALAALMYGRLLEQRAMMRHEQRTRQRVIVWRQVLP